MITLQQATLKRAQKVLIENTTLTIHSKQKIGLIGDNGSGKSSFFAMLQGELELHQGSLFLPNQLAITHVKQETPTSKNPAIDYVIEGDYQYCQIMEALKIAEEQGDPYALGECHDQLASINGYAITGKAEKILKGLGFKPDELSKPTTEFSGGWRMRLNLAQALMSPANLMLLDEPTNHLDLDAIIWLEKWLQDYSGTLLIISHDREFLDNTINYILQFTQQSLRLYRGNYSQFEKQQAEQIMLQQAAYTKQQAQITHMQSFIDRFRAKATKAKQAQSRLKALQKIDLIAAVQTQAAFQFKFRPPKACPNPLVRIEKANIGYSAANLVLTDVDVQIVPENRIGLLGVNGAGKSTLIKVIADKLPPISGLVHFYKGIKIGYFAQHQVEHLNFNLSPLELLKEIAGNHSEQELRNFLGTFNFSKEMATNKIAHFSGGEKARLALALIVWQAPNLLLLDEPTNHLDMNLREALILALQEYTGALILVSHDRHLIRTTTDELLVINDGQVERFIGDLDDYRENVFIKLADKPTPKVNKNPGKEKTELESKLGSLEKALKKLQKQAEILEGLLADPKLYENQENEAIKTYQQQLNELRTEIQKVEENWLRLFEQLERM